jgi:hypothetical protein
MNKALKVLWMGILSASILSNPSISYPGRDSGIFLYIGSLILKGKIPYIDAWENKGPLVFYINALGLFLTGGSRWGIWALEFIFLLMAGAIGYAAMKRIMGEIPALIGTFVWVNAAGNVLQGGNFSEEYSLLFSFIAVLFFLKSIENMALRGAERRSNPQQGAESASSGYRPPRNDELIIGATLGFNILLRPNNISIQVAIAGAYFLLAILSKDWHLLINRAIQIAIGTLVVIVPVLLYFAAHNALTEMINVVIVFNSQYSEGGGLPRFIEGIANATRGIGIPLVAVAFLGYIIALISLFKRDALDTPLGKFLPVLLIGLPLEAFLSGLSGKNYPHYFIGWSLYVGFFWSYVVYVLINQMSLRGTKQSPSAMGLLRREERPPHNNATPLIFILLIITFAAHIDTWKNYGAAFESRITHRAPLDYRDPIVDYIQKHTSPEDKVLVWGFRPIINFVSQRESPVTYLPYPLSHVDTPLARYWADGFYSQLTARPPILIINMIEPADRERIPDLDPEIRKQYKIKWRDVVLAHNYKDVLEFIRQNYTRVDTVNGFDIYRLNIYK